MRMKVLIFLLTIMVAACGNNPTKVGDNRDTAIVNKKASKPLKAEKPEREIAKTKPVQVGRKKEQKEAKDNITTDVGGGNTMLAMVNKARTKGCKCGSKYYPPTHPLKWNAKLERAAQKHSAYMKRRNLLTHNGKGGSDPGMRMKREGYNWMSFGENVGAGYRNYKEAMQGWLNSKGHCKNIMNPKFKEMGAARSGVFWTQDFGRQ